MGMGPGVELGLPLGLVGRVSWRNAKRSVALGALILASCLGGGSRLRPHGWREVERQSTDAFEADFGPVSVAVSDLRISRNLARAKFWVVVREIGTVSVEEGDIQLIEPSGRVCPNQSGARREIVTRVRPEPFAAVFEVSDVERVLSRGCRVRMPVVPFEPSEGPPIEVVVPFYPR